MPCFASGSTGPRPHRFLFAIIVLFCCGIAPATAQNPEVGTPSDGPVTSISVRPLDYELTASYGYVQFMEQDMNDTYSGLSTLGIEASIGVSEETRFFLSVRRGTTRGSPFYDTPEFTSGLENELTALPMLLGFRANVSEHPRFHVYLGTAFIATWIREKVPSTFTGEQSALEEHKGLGTGFLVSVMPQWRSAGDRYAVGVEIDLGGASGRVGKGQNDHEVNLTGVSARLTVSLEI